MQTERLFLIGSRCTGKTTVARILADRLGWDCVDADEALEQRYGQSIRTIFAAEGEPGFRAKEAAMLSELCRRRRHVIATGGGVVLWPDNRDRLRQAGRVVWLTADAATLWDRSQTDPTTAERRPDLSVGGLADIEQTLQARAPIYAACADWTVSTVGRSPEEVAGLILAQLGDDR
jgi:shikimate kinase